MNNALLLQARARSSNALAVPCCGHRAPSCHAILCAPRPIPDPDACLPSHVALSAGDAARGTKCERPALACRPLGRGARTAAKAFCKPVRCFSARTQAYAARAQHRPRHEPGPEASYEDACMCRMQPCVQA